MKTVKLNSISEVKTEAKRKDGKVSRQYYTAYFSDASNPFAPARQRNIFQSHNADGSVATWKSGDPSIVKQYVGKEIPGEFVNAKVTPYMINERMADNVTTIVLAGENLSSVLKQQGYTLATETKVEAKVEALNG